MTASISFQSVEDRRTFLRKTFAEENEEGKKFLKDLNEDGTLDWRDLAVEKEEVWFIEDQSGNGVAERAQLYLKDFGEEITDVANGVEVAYGDVYIAVGPDLWKSKDKDGDGIADEVESLSHGYAVHIGFSGHGMSGVKMGPDGRIYWGIGDIGANVIDKKGKQWKYPNRGVIARCEPDGSNFEIFCMGVRNTHEFDFDKYGNLISVDNDGDHAGEAERLVYLINGSDTGWRINWQFGKYTDPKNNKYKVWIDEKMGVPAWDGQPGHILPCIQNYVNGPTGLVYNPGTALSEKFEDHFFVAEFRGTPSQSPIHAFKLKPEGASFSLDTTFEVVKGLLPTGIDFGPEGAMYFGDWIDGWGTKDRGYIWKLDVPNGAETQIRKETKTLIQADFKDKNEEDLAGLLGHPDYRVRQKAQFALVEREEAGLMKLEESAKTSKNQMARIHALWGMHQFARKDNKVGENLFAFLQDADEEIITQAVKVIGDIKLKSSIDKLLQFDQTKNARLQMHVIEALGRIGDKKGMPYIIKVVEENNDQDLWIRQAAMVALGRIGDSKALQVLNNHPSDAVRLAAVVALRRMEDPAVASFLNDKNEAIATDAARAINDDFSIESALPALAKILINTSITNEAFLRRSINANVRVGKNENVDILANFSSQVNAPSSMRSEALDALSSFNEPSVFDRVDGRYRGPIEREADYLQKVMAAKVPELMAADDQVKIAAINLTGELNLTDNADLIFQQFNSSKEAKLKSAALNTLHKLNSKDLASALNVAINSKEEVLRSAAIKIIPSSYLEEASAVKLFSTILDNGTILEKQAALSALTKFKGAEALGLLTDIWDRFKSGKAEPEIELDLFEAMEAQDSPDLKTALKQWSVEKEAEGPLASYQSVLFGGDKQRGHAIFYEHTSAQCVRCHSIWEYGGTAGPDLNKLNDRMDEQSILESLILPSAKIAKGYAVASLELVDGKTIGGMILEEDAQNIKLKVGIGDIQDIAKSKIKDRTDIPSSMPAVNNLLNKKEIRDLMAFLKTL